MSSTMVMRKTSKGLSRMRMSGGLRTAVSCTVCPTRCLQDYLFRARTFDFECDRVPHRWGINFIAFASLSHGHFGAMRDLGYNVKNKDEIYFSMCYPHNINASAGPHSTKSAPPPRFTSCAVGRAHGCSFHEHWPSNELATIFWYP